MPQKGACSMNINPTPRKNRVVLIREDLFTLTKSTYKTIILGQFIYWSERMADTDKYILEESERMKMDGVNSNFQPSFGWIYKRAEELIEETMLDISRQTANRLLQSLVDDGYLLSRRNPEHKYDRTKQYRVDFVRIRNELHKIRYYHSSLAWLTESDAKLDMSIRENKGNIPENPQNNGMLNMSIGKSKISFEKLNVSDQKMMDERAIPEITYREKNNDNNNNSHVQIMDDEKNSIQLTEYTSLGAKQMSFSKYEIPGEQKNKFAWKEPSMTPLEPFIPFHSSSELETAAACTEISNSTDRRPLIPDNGPYVQVDKRMSQHLGRIYIAKQDDYRAIKQLLGSQVPLDFILAGIDFTFANFGDREINSFGYCAKVITQQWALEKAKREDVRPIDRREALEAEGNLQRPRTSKAQLPVTERHDKYETFYNLFLG